MNTKQPVRPKMDELLKVAIPADQKRRLFEIAARKNTTVSEMVRAAISEVATQAA